MLLLAREVKISKNYAHFLIGLEVGKIYGGVKLNGTGSDTLIMRTTFIIRDLLIKLLVSVLFTHTV